MVDEDVSFEDDFGSAGVSNSDDEYTNMNVLTKTELVDKKEPLPTNCDFSIVRILPYYKQIYVQKISIFFSFSSHMILQSKWKSNWRLQMSI